MRTVCPDIYTAWIVQHHIKDIPKSTLPRAKSDWINQLDAAPVIDYLHAEHYLYGIEKHPTVTFSVRWYPALDLWNLSHLFMTIQPTDTQNWYNSAMLQNKGIYILGEKRVTGWYVDRATFIKLSDIFLVGLDLSSLPERQDPPISSNEDLLSEYNNKILIVDARLLHGIAVFDRDTHLLHYASREFDLDEALRMCDELGLDDAKRGLEMIDKPDLDAFLSVRFDTKVCLREDDRREADAAINAHKELIASQPQSQCRKARMKSLDPTESWVDSQATSRRLRRWKSKSEIRPSNFLRKDDVPPPPYEAYEPAWPGSCLCSVTSSSSPASTLDSTTDASLASECQSTLCDSLDYSADRPPAYASIAGSHNAGPLSEKNQQPVVESQSMYMIPSQGTTLVDTQDDADRHEEEEGEEEEEDSFHADSPTQVDSYDDFVEILAGPNKRSWRFEDDFNYDLFPSKRRKDVEGFETPQDIKDVKDVKVRNDSLAYNITGMPFAR